MSSEKLFWSLLFHSLIFFTFCQDEKPKFRILAPQFICGPDKVVEETKIENLVQGETKIRFQTKAGEKLSFSWDIRFKVIDGPKGQRFNIIVWYAVRALEKFLNSLSSQIAESNQVAINNTQLIEGVNYTFNITAKSEKGVTGDTNSFGIKYSDAKSAPKLELGDSISDEQFSLIMLGSEVVYADMTYILQADVIPCKPSNNYYFSWKVVNLNTSERIEIGEIMGEKLTILPGILIGSHYYDIACEIIRISDGGLITKSGLFTKVKERGMSIEFNIDFLIVPINTQFSLIAVLKNPDNLQGKLLLTWHCRILPDLRECLNFMSVNQTEYAFEEGLPEKGVYRLEVTVVKGNASASRTVDINVEDGMLPFIHIGYGPRLIATNKVLEIHALVSDLRSGCRMQWILVQEQDFGYFNISTLPGPFKSLSLHSLDEMFLSELVEFSNETMLRNFPLVIPVTSGSWQGLEPETKYKFRLQVDCECTQSYQCEGPPNVTAYADVVIETNSPPQPMELLVKPLIGTALQTSFIFSTKAAIDIPTDMPLTYTFSFKRFPNETVTIKSFLENLVTETILPFSENPLIPQLTVCDARGGCSSIDGEPINVTMPSKITTEDLTNLSDKFEVKLFRKEYAEAFYLAFLTLQTLTGIFEDLNAGFLSHIEKYIRNDVQKQISSLNKNNMIASNNFIIAITLFLQKFQVSEDLVRDILKLKESVSELIHQSSIIHKEDSSKFETF